MKKTTFQIMSIFVKCNNKVKLSVEFEMKGPILSAGFKSVWEYYSQK